MDLRSEGSAIRGQGCRRKPKPHPGSVSNGKITGRITGIEARVSAAGSRVRRPAAASAAPSVASGRAFLRAVQMAAAPAQPNGYFAGFEHRKEWRSPGGQGGSSGWPLQPCVEMAPLTLTSHEVDALLGSSRSPWPEPGPVCCSCHDERSVRGRGPANPL